MRACVCVSSGLSTGLASLSSGPLAVSAEGAPVAALAGSWPVLSPHCPRFRLLGCKWPGIPLRDPNRIAGVWSGAVWPGPSNREIASTQLSALTGVDCTHFCSLASTPLPRGPEAGVAYG